MVEPSKSSIERMKPLVQRQSRVLSKTRIVVSMAGVSVAVLLAYASHASVGDPARATSPIPEPEAYIVPAPIVHVAPDPVGTTGPATVIAAGEVPLNLDDVFTRTRMGRVPIVV